LRLRQQSYSVETRTPMLSNGGASTRRRQPHMGPYCAYVGLRYFMRALEHFSIDSTDRRI
jgi:hypothetical protein